MSKRYKQIKNDKDKGNNKDKKVKKKDGVNDNKKSERQQERRELFLFRTTH